MFLSGQAGSIALMAIRSDPSDTGNFLLEIKVSSGTVRVRATTQPDAESATLIVNDVATATFIERADSQLGIDFSNSSNVFNTIATVSLDPALGSTLQMFAAVNFTWTV